MLKIKFRNVFKNKLSEKNKEKHSGDIFEGKIRKKNPKQKVREKI
jgi:hypothetical protein